MNDLAKWIEKNSNKNQFAKTVGVSAMAVKYWCEGALPRKDHREKIKAATNGEVLPESFL